MSRQRYTPEFNDEAVRQVTERGPSVVDVAARLGVSSHRLYEWGKAVEPSKVEERSDELLESKKEIPRLRAALSRASVRRFVPASANR